MTTFGWDASNYDDPIRVADGIVLYTHKAAEGHHFYYDREYKVSLDAARALDIPILGAYFVNHPGTVSDQVDWFVELLDRDTPWWREHPCFVLQIDAEKFDYMNRAPTLAEIQAFGDRLVQVHGVNPAKVLVYAPQWLYGNTLTGLTFQLWASNYGANPVAHYLDCYPGDGSGRWVSYSGQTPLLLQYGSNTTIGDQTTCDANAYRGSLDELLMELGAEKPTQQMGVGKMLMIGRSGEGEGKERFWLGDGFYHREIADQGRAESILGTMKWFGTPEKAVINTWGDCTPEFVWSIIGPTPYPEGNGNSELVPHNHDFSITTDGTTGQPNS